MNHMHNLHIRARNILTNTVIIIILCIIIIILSAICMGFGIATNNEVNGIDNRLCTTTESLACTDFNPCTRDIIQPINCGGGSLSGPDSCASFECTNVPLANGSCCNQYDFCYYDDPGKTCLFGTCQSSDPTLCKGYCNEPEDCLVPIPLTVNVDAIDTDCVFHSCVTIVTVATYPITNPFSLINTSNGNLTALNISGCLMANCVSDFLDDFTVCLYQWKCGPYVGLENEKKKKKREFEDLHQTNYSNVSYYFNLVPLIGTNYLQANWQINQIVLNNIAQNSD